MFILGKRTAQEGGLEPINHCLAIREVLVPFKEVRKVLKAREREGIPNSHRSSCLESRQEHPEEER